MLAYVTGSVNEDLLRRIECFLEENRVLRNQLDKRLRLTDSERRMLAEKAIALGKLDGRHSNRRQPPNPSQLAPYAGRQEVRRRSISQAARASAHQSRD